MRYLRSPAWKEKRERALLLADYMCQKCGATDRLQVHHKTYVRFRNEYQSDLEVLCKPCHDLLHPRKVRRKKKKRPVKRVAKKKQ